MVRYVLWFAEVRYGSPRVRQGSAKSSPKVRKGFAEGSVRSL